MADVLMPRLSDSMEEGTILRWLKRSGDEVRRGEELAEIETDKATMTYEADADGVLEIVATEGETLPIGSVIARLGAEAPAGEGSSNGAPPSQLAGPVDDTSAPAAGAAEASRVTPPARPQPAAPS